MIEDLIGFVAEYHRLLSTVAIISFFICVVGILSIPYVLSAIPENYFDKKEENSHEQWTVWFVIRKMFKNILAILLVLAGIAMLFLPGQGLLTLLVGLMLLDYPNKKALERKIISHPKVLRIINQARRNRGSKEFNFSDD